jgi:peptidyl-tRNA hydrolase
VLSPFSKAERETIVELMPRLTDGIELWLREGIEQAMNEHNREQRTH